MSDYLDAVRDDASSLIGTDELTLSEIVMQLLSCGYECKAGPLRNNVAFQDLVAKAHAEGCPNWGLQPSGHYSGCGVCTCCVLFRNI